LPCLCHNNIIIKYLDDYSIYTKECSHPTGNIKLPASKNNPNNNEPTNTYDLKLSFSFMIFSFRCLSYKPYIPCIPQ
jgi:hypothetical protein